MRLLSALFAISFVIGLLSGIQQQATAHDVGWIYNHTNITVEDGGTSYGSAILSATSDWDYWTDLTVTMPSCSSSCDIIVNQANWGDIGWIGFADAINVLGQYCANWPTGVVNGNCNRTDRKASHGYIWINTGYGALTNANYTMRHELGHHFGMSHVACGTASIMNVNCGYDYSSIQPHDISDINAWY